MLTNNKQREALGKILWCLEWMFNNTDDKSVQSHLGEPIALAKAALAEPVRNYEVGTMEELYGRYEKFCRSHFNNDGDNCLKCPFSQPTCKFAWAQIPYDEGGAK